MQITGMTRMTYFWGSDEFFKDTCTQGSILSPKRNENLPRTGSLLGFVFPRL